MATGHRRLTEWGLSGHAAPPVGILPVTDHYRASSPTIHHGHGSPLVGNHRLTVQGYSDYDQPPPCPPSCWDTPGRQTNHFRQQRSPRPGTQPWQPNRTVFDPPSHQRSAAPLPAAVPPPIPQRSPSNHLSRTVSCLEQPATVHQYPLLQHLASGHPTSLRSATKLVSCEEKQLGVEGDSDVLNQVDLRLNGMKLVDEEVCYETEWIPSSHSSSLDHDLDAHPKMKPNDSLNWRGSFLDVVDESKSSILDDNHDKAIYNDDEFTEMKPQSARLSDDSDLHRDVVGVSCSSSSPSCVDNSSLQKCWDSDDEDEDDRADVLSQHQNLVQQMKVELRSCDIRCLPTIYEDSVTPKMIEDLRPRKSDHMIRYKVLKETEAFTTGKTRADSVLPRFLAGKGHRDLEMVYVGQLCLSWEILWRLDAKTRKLLYRDGEGRCTYSRTAEELQQFQVLVKRDDKFVGLVSNLDKNGTRLKEQMRSEECIVRKLRKHQERGWERILGFLSVIAFDTGGEFSMLVLSSTWSVVSWFPP